MSAHYLLYTALKEIDPCYVGSGQLVTRGVRGGDVIWSVQLRKKRLYVVGRLPVYNVGDYGFAREMLGGEPAYKSPWFALCDPRHVPAQKIADITALVPDLRFTGENDRLTLRPDGTFEPMQLRAMRELTAEAAQQLNEAWNKTSG